MDPDALDLRLHTNRDFTLKTKKTNPLKREELDEFVSLFKPGARPPHAQSDGSEKNPLALERSDVARALLGLLVHVLRHTFCSHLAMRGAMPTAIQALAGHTTLGVTSRYMHLSPAAKDGAIKLLNQPEVPVEAGMEAHPSPEGKSSAFR